jgi:hypothetical protein
MFERMPYPWQHERQGKGFNTSSMDFSNRSASALARERLSSARSNAWLAAFPA